MFKDYRFQLTEAPIGADGPVIAGGEFIDALGQTVAKVSSADKAQEIATMIERMSKVPGSGGVVAAAYCAGCVAGIRSGGVPNDPAN